MVLGKSPPHTNKLADAGACPMALGGRCGHVLFFRNCFRYYHLFSSALTSFLGYDSCADSGHNCNSISIWPYRALVHPTNESSSSPIKDGDSRSSDIGIRITSPSQPIPGSKLFFLMGGRENMSSFKLTSYGCRSNSATWRPDDRQRPCFPHRCCS